MTHQLTYFNPIVNLEILFLTLIFNSTLEYLDWGRGSENPLPKIWLLTAMVLKFAY